MAGGFSFTLTLRGQGQVIRRLPATWQRYSDAAGKTLLQEGQAILRLARQLAPVRTGALRRSGYAVAIPVSRGGSTVLVGFSIYYAGIVHATHPTKAFFLDYAYKLAAAWMKARLERGIRAGVR